MNLSRAVVWVRVRLQDHWRRKLSARKVVQFHCRVGSGHLTPFSVNLVVLTVGQPLPVYPDQRTFAGYVGMSQTHQERPFCDRK
jgi:hypothetical protein